GEREEDIFLILNNYNLKMSKIADPVGKSGDHIEKTASSNVLRSCSDEIFGAKSNKKVVKIQELRNENVVKGATVTIPFKAVEEVKSRFSNTLYGFFIGKRLAFPLVENYNKYGIDKVLEDGPWLIHTVPLILNVWSPNTDLKKTEVKKAPIWIKLHHVPIVAYSKIGLSLITTQLGKPIMLDSYTSSMCLDYSLWEVIINGDSPTPTVVIEGVVRPATILSADQNLPSERKTHTLIWRNKTNLEEHSLDDLFNSLKIYETEVRHSFSLANPTQNLAFVSSSNIDSTTDLVSVVIVVFAVCTQLPVSSHPNIDSLSNAVIFSFFASQSTSPQLDNEDLKQIDVDDLEEMDLRWQMAMLTIRARRFLQKTRRNLGDNRVTTIGFDMSKLECYNCHRKGHFYQECRSPKDTRRTSVAEPQRRHVPVETSTSNALVSQYDGIGSYDWSYQVEEEPANFGLMAIPSSSFASDNEPTEHVKPSRHSDQPIEASILAATPKLTSLKTNCSGKRKNRKTCFVYRSVDHLIKDCNFHAKPKTQPTPSNNAHMGYNKQHTSFTKKYLQKHIVPAVVLTKSKPVSVTVVRQVSAVVPKIMISRLRHAHSLNTKSNSTIRMHRTRNQFSKTSNSSSKFTTAKASVVNAVNKKKGKWVWRPKCPILDHGSRTSELNGGYVALGGNPKGGKISDFKLPDESQVLLRVPRENNMYNVNLKDIVLPIYKGDLIRGLPTKVFENHNTCVACKKGKQHRASCKTKPVSSVNQPLFRLHMDLFGPTFVKSLNKKSYCLVITDDYSRFTWVFFLATKDETSPILKTFITSLENQLSLKVKVIRSDNGTEFKNSDLNQTLIEAARTKLADLLIPIPFWSEAVNTACFVQNRVLVTKPHNKTPYELLHGRTPSIGFMRSFGCLVTILNTVDSLGKFEGKVDERFLVGYSVNREEADQQYMLFPMWSTGSSNPQNKEGDAGFDEKEHDTEKPESAVNLSLSNNFKDYSEDISNDVSAAGPIVPTAGKNYYNNTNLISVVGPSNSNTSPTHGKSSLRDAYQPPDMIEREDIFYSDHENVGAEADFNNLKTSITSAFLYGTIEEEVYVCQPPGFEDPDHPDKVYKVVKALYGLHQDPRACQDKYVAKSLKKFSLTKGKSASSPIDIEKPLLKDPNGEDVDVHIYRSMIDSLLYLTSSRPDIMFANWLVQKQMALGKDKANPLTVDSLLKTIWLSIHHLLNNEVLTIPGQTTTASDASEGFNQIIDFLNGSYIEYALIMNPTIYVSCIKQFWRTVAVKQSNDVTRLQALVDKKKVVVTEAAIRDALHLDDAEGVDCLPNEEIFTELARIGYEKPSTKLTFYKAFFSSQWKFVIHTILQLMSAKRKSWNEFSSAMASVVIFLSTGRKFNFSKYIFESLVRNVDNSSKFYMYPRVETPLFEGMLVAREPEEQGDVEEQGRIIDELDRDEGAVLMNEKEETKEVRDNTDDVRVKERQADIYQIDMDHATKVLSMQEDESEVQEAMELVTTAKLITEVVAAVSDTVSAAAVTKTVSATAIVPTVTAAPVKSKDKGKGIMVEEPKPMKKKQQVELDEAYARKLHKEINQDIDWEVAIDHVKQKAKEDPFIQRY
nr:hypothetical protein [Tanacetum cinerariifolium]